MDRMPIQTYVMEFNDEMIREAIERECFPGGQVYYVYNRVEDIADVAGQGSEAGSGSVVAYAHGQMREHELEGSCMILLMGRSMYLYPLRS